VKSSSSSVTSDIKSYSIGSIDTTRIIFGLASESLKLEVNSSPSTEKPFFTTERGGKILSVAGFLNVSKIADSWVFPLSAFLLTFVTSFKESTFFLPHESTPLSFCHGIFPFVVDVMNEPLQTKCLFSLLIRHLILIAISSNPLPTKKYPLLNWRFSSDFLNPFCRWRFVIGLFTTREYPLIIWGFGGRSEGFRCSLLLVCSWGYVLERNVCFFKTKLRPFVILFFFPL